MEKSTELVFLLLLFTLIGGFYMVLSDIQEVKTEIANLNSQMQLIAGGEVDVPANGSNNTTSTNGATSTDDNEEIENVDGTEVPTSILFSTQSSPLLSPQTELTVSLERFVKSDDGTLTLYIEVFSDKAESYSAINPGNLFELVNIGGSNQKPLQTAGPFDAIPPQSSVNGTVTFKTEASNQEVILRVQTEGDTTHYRFNFDEESYEEAILG